MDRYGNKLADSAIILYEIDLGYDQDDGETYSKKLSAHSIVPDIIVAEVDIGGGADWPALAIQLLDKFLPQAALISLFFSGEKIKKNFLAWSEILGYVRSKVSKFSFGNRSYSGLIALEAISEQEKFEVVQLLAYRQFDEYIDFEGITDSLEEAAKIISKDECIIIPKRMALHSIPIDAFRVITDQGEWAIAVRTDQVLIRELSSNC